jgi:hypothetical protein
MTTSNQTIPVHHESTYEMLVESAENKSGVMEILIYFLLIAATVATIWQFGTQPVTFAELGKAHAQEIAALNS